MSGLEAVFVASLAAVAYAYTGYALLLAAWSRLAPRPVARGPHAPPVTIVVVAHDAAGLIERKLETCLAQRYPAQNLRVLVASDGSTDDTAARVARHPDPRVEVLAFPARRGKAQCLNDALAACRTPLVVLTDARQALEPDAVARLAENFADPAVGAASGELVFRAGGMTAAGRGLDAYWRHEKWIRRAESAIHSTVGVSGALYAIRREAFRPIPADTVLDDVLVPMNVVTAGQRVVFDARAIAWDEASRDLAQERARKVRTLAGNFQLLARHPGLLLPWRNPIALQLASHKAMRLAAPFALAAALAANALLAATGPLYAATLTLQAAGYGLALLGLAWPASRRVLPVRLAATFLSLNAFVVLGLVEFLTNRGAHLWSSPGPGRADA